MCVPYKGKKGQMSEYWCHIPLCVFVAEAAPSLGLPEGLVHGTLIDLLVDVSK